MTTVPADEAAALAALRARLHALPEPAGAERRTAALVANELRACGPERLLAGLGGHGVAAVFGGGAPTVVLRAELDALPDDPPGRGCAHRCGHDGHMAILLGVARRLAARRPARGRAVLLFQPAEETGAGALAVAADPRFAALAPDWLFALHNLPGHPRGTVLVRPGVFCAAHARLTLPAPADAAAASRLVAALAALPVPCEAEGGRCLVTVDRTAGGTVSAMLQADDDAGMARLRRAAAALAAAPADTAWSEELPVVRNHPEAAAAVARAARAAGLAVAAPDESPFRWTEDVGVLTAGRRGALFGLGAGRGHPALHDDGYDFPDELLAPGLATAWALLNEVLGPF